ncbi:hypothetical protein Taro_014490, partial [Colocasia esculenta]|nr:hypothetical protein [Colocasia esculenta]
FVVSVYCFSMLPSLVWYVCGLWVALGWSITSVCFSVGVATAVCVATLEEAVVVTVPFLVAMGRLALRTFRWGTQQVTWLRSVTEGDTFVAVSWLRC